MKIEKKTVQKFFLILLTLTIISCNDDENLATEDDAPISVFTGNIEWLNNFGGSLEDEASSIIQTPDGGFAFAGYTFSNDGDITDKSSTDADFWVVKLSPEGQIIWSKTYGGSDDERAMKIINTNDGGFAVIGYSRSNDGDVSFNNGFYDYWLIKLDASGNLQWEKTHGYPGNDQGQSLIQTSDGGYFLTGFLDVSASNGEGNDDRIPREPLHGVGEFWGIKTDANGDFQWRRYFGGMDNDRSYGVVETDNGDFLMVGNSESIDFDITNPIGSYDFWAVRINDMGDLIWAKNYGGTDIDIAYGITKSQDGNYFIYGDTRSIDVDVTNAKGNADGWVIKINDAGELLWQKTYGGTQFDTTRSVNEFNDNTLVVFGTSRSSDIDVSANYGQSDFWLLITDENGNIQMEKNYGGSKLEFGNSSVITLQNKVIIAGNSESDDFDVPENKGSKDALVLLLN